MSAESTTVDVTTAQRAAEGLINRHRHPSADDHLAAIGVAVGLALAVGLGSILAHLAGMW